MRSKTQQNSKECGRRWRVDGLVVDRDWESSPTLPCRLFWALSLPAHHVSSLSTCVCILDWLAPNSPAHPTPLPPVGSNYLLHSLPRLHLCIFTAPLPSSSYHLHFSGLVLDINAGGADWPPPKTWCIGCLGGNLLLEPIEVIKKKWKKMDATYLVVTGGQKTSV